MAAKRLITVLVALMAMSGCSSSQDTVDYCSVLADKSKIDVKEKQVFYKGKFIGPIDPDDKTAYSKVPKVLPNGSSGFQCFQFASDQYFLSGGWSKGLSGTAPPPASSKNFLYQVKTRNYEVLPDMHSARADHTIQKLDDGNLLIVGGISDTTGSGYEKSIEIFSPSQKTVKACGDLHIARVNPSILQLDNRRILIAGGQVAQKGVSESEMVELLDIANMSSTIIGRLHIARQGAQMFKLNDHEVLILSGWNSNSDENSNNPAAEIIQIKKGG